MSFAKWFKGLVNQGAEQWMVCPIPSERVTPTHAVQPLQAEKAYVRVWLAEMLLSTRRQWFKTFAPVVHSVVSLRYGAGVGPKTDVEVPYVVGPLGLKDVDAGHLDRVIQLNHALTGLLPFRGGSVSLSAGLFRAQQADYLTNLLGVLGALSGLLTAPELSTAIEIAKPVAEALSGLLSSADGGLELGLHDTWVGPGGDAADNLLVPGYVVVARATADQLPSEELSVRNGHLERAGKPLEGVSYMLLRLESRTERDDWSALSAINEPMTEMQRALGRGDAEAARAELARARVATLGSADLTRLDAMRVAKALQTVFDEDSAVLGLEAVRERRSLADAVARVDPREVDLSDRALTRLLAQP